MLVVAALGGNALADIAEEHQLVVTHGNGPQVGLLALQAEAYTDVQSYPLDVLGAESEGMIGYLLEQGLENRIAGARVATLLTQVVVDPDDPAFGAPTKPVGPVYERAQAERLARERGWTIAPDGPGWRRVVPSPEPLRVVEMEAISTLIAADMIVVCVGGGGVPVIVDGHGRLRGVEAVIDKDLAATLLARQLGADALLLLTDVPAIQADWGRPTERPIATIAASELAKLELAGGSMGPKAKAASRFVTGTGAFAVIGALADAGSMLSGATGTQVVPDAYSTPSGQGDEPEGLHQAPT